MTSQAPARIRVDLQLLTVLQRILSSAAPQEACALLLGERLDRDWLLRGIWPCCNVWPVPQERARRFAIDPREQLLAQKWGRLRRLEVLGSAHSHPEGAAVPSATDRRLAVRPALMVIHGAAGPGPELMAWWLPEGDGPPRALPLGAGP